MAVLGATFDHLAIVVERDTQPRQWLADQLSARPVGGAEAPGFRSEQWQFVNGMRLEMLEPFRESESDFVRRFLARSGPGPHHLTFRVGDIDQAMLAIRDAGFPILYSRTDDPGWREAFIHPRHAFGTVLQLAEYPDDAVETTEGAQSVAGASALTVVEMDVSDLQHASQLFGEALGGETVCASRSEIRLAWPDTAMLLLRQVSAERLAQGAGRIAGVHFRGVPLQARPVLEKVGTQAYRHPALATAMSFG